MINKKFSRRDALKLVTASAITSSLACSEPTPNPAKKDHSSASPALRDNWKNTFDRVWIGGNYWANPMEDWHLVQGRATCKSRSGNRSIHSLTHRLENADQPFQVSVVVHRSGSDPQQGGAGIRLGVNNEIDEYRSSCFVQKGLDLGIAGDQLVIGRDSTPLSKPVDDTDIQLTLLATPQSGTVSLQLSAHVVASGEKIGSLEQVVAASNVLGNVALVSNFALPSNAQGQDLGALYQFSEWHLQGNAFQVRPERKFGPILWSMYSLSDSRKEEGFVLKLSAICAPMGTEDNPLVELQVQRANEWITLQLQPLDPDAWVATFRVANWDEKVTTPFRVIYREQHVDGSVTPDIWQGTVRANPDSGELRMAALTCQNDYSFPYAPVVDNVARLDPDLVFFSGDQIYESHGGFGIVRSPFNKAILNYLRKFYQFGWAFGDVMRDRPTICLPDDHDVFQGNLWGEGGEPNQFPEKDPSASFFGGYIEPVRFVNAVHRTCVSHHPEAFDPTPTPSGMSCYYGDMVYGNVGFAILADRQWKSGPEQAGVVVGETGTDEDPTFINPAINPESPELLGARQEAFLARWAKDWRGHTMKAVLSQTVFAGISTHQPTPQRYLKYDFDSSGWPGPARNQAVAIMRESKALHICGDTHLPSLAQYGVDAQRDSNWSFCTPAISAGWPRWWLPDQLSIPHQNRPTHKLPHTGEYIDSFGNKVYVYAVGIPEVGKSRHRYIKAHEKGSGFGFVTFDTEKHTFTMQAYRYLVNVLDNSPNNQFPGWPVTIHQDENHGDNMLS
ncbi:alkaline phosphatase D family protein [Microbulbifer mangrovi]|uniref:alkaline phosphatase D family protein n=1 Tax=Microbulbifer mangrovi TaxID=927787 RepID=UPI0009908215|nr:alkaline phosphatase D family protein [Microbulbifer mangrovi]